MLLEDILVEALLAFSLNECLPDLAFFARLRLISNVLELIDLAHGTNERSLHLTGLLRVLSIVIAPLALVPSFASTPDSQVLQREIHSEHFDQSKIGTNSLRKVVLYLPPGYDTSAARYPVIYFLPDTSDGYSFPFDHANARSLFDRAIANGAIAKFIFVSVDMNTPVGNSWSVNSGYGAIRFAMRHPDVFGSVYALHPVGVGPGIQPMYSRPNWDLLTSAKSLADIRSDGFSMVFTAIFQAFLPNPNKPPLFADLPARKVGGQLMIDSGLTNRLQNNFFLEKQIPAWAENMKSLNAFKFD